MPTATQELLTAEEFSRPANPIDGSRQELVRGEANVAPDLCVEVLLPANRPRKMQERIREYFASGDRIV